MDMSAFIVAKSDQLNADDLIGGPRTVRITGVRGSDDRDQPVAVSFEGDQGKPYKPCKSMRRVMVAVWGKDAANYTGRSMTLYRDPEVQFGGMKVGGIRISHMSDISEKKQMALTATRGKKGLYTVLPLTGAPPPQQQPTEDAAATWVDGFIARIGGMNAIGEIEAFEAEKAARLTELKNARPQLHDHVMKAIEQRKAQLGAPPSSSFADDDLTRGPATSGGYEGV